MTNNEKLALIEEIAKTRKIATNKAGYSVVGAGVIAIGIVLKPALIGIAIGMTGPVMASVGLGGSGIILVNRLLKKSKVQRQRGA